MLPVLIGILVVPTFSAAQKNNESLSRLQARITQLSRSFPGTIGIYARNIESGEEVSYRADDPFPMASVLKIPLLVHLFRSVDAGSLSLSDRVEMGEADWRDGSGLLTHLNPGLKPTIQDLMTFMITVSDNEATDKLLGMAGAQNVTATMRTLGIQGIRLDRPTAESAADYLSFANGDPHKLSPAELVAHPEVFDVLTIEQLDRAGKAFAEDPRDHATPRAMSELFVKIFRSEAASEKSCRDMLNILKLQQFNDRIPRYLPDGVAVAHKTGEIGFTLNDAGIIYAGKSHIVITLFALKANTDVSDDQTKTRMAEIARVVYDFFSYKD